MRYTVRGKKGPYDGPFTKSIITYFLEDDNGKTIFWHEGPNKKLNAEIGDVITGLVVRDDDVVDYNKSNIEIILKQ